MDIMEAINSSVLEKLYYIFHSNPDIKEVLLYGSRAKGNFNERSDIDLVLKNSKIDRYTLGMLQMEIDNSDIPYLVSLQIYEDIKDNKLLQEIDKHGILIYKFE